MCGDFTHGASCEPYFTTGSADAAADPGERGSSVPVPVQTVSCRFARELLANMTGYIAPVTWRGGVTGVTYAIEDQSEFECGRACCGDETRLGLSLKGL